MNLMNQNVTAKAFNPLLRDGQWTWFENVVYSSFQLISFKFWKNSKLSTLIILISSLRQSKSRKQGQKYDSAYQETQIGEKISENKARKQKWSGSLTITRQRYISASRHRVNLALWVKKRLKDFRSVNYFVLARRLLD